MSTPLKLTLPMLKSSERVKALETIQTRLTSLLDAITVSPREDPQRDIEISFLLSLRPQVAPLHSPYASVLTTWLTGIGSGYKTYEELVAWRQKMLDRFSKHAYDDSPEYRRDMLVFQLFYHLDLQEE